MLYYLYTIPTFMPLPSGSATTSTPPPPPPPPRRAISNTATSARPRSNRPEQLPSYQEALLASIYNEYETSSSSTWVTDNQGGQPSTSFVDDETLPPPYSQCDPHPEITSLRATPADPRPPLPPRASRYRSVTEYPGVRQRGILREISPMPPPYDEVPTRISTSVEYQDENDPGTTPTGRHPLPPPPPPPPSVAASVVASDTSDKRSNSEDDDDDDDNDDKGDDDKLEDEIKKLLARLERLNW